MDVYDIDGGNAVGFGWVEVGRTLERAHDTNKGQL